MLGSNELWFSCVNDLNDTSEYDHFMKAVPDIIPSLRLSRDYDVIGKNIERSRQQNKANTFVSSWCEFDESRKDGRLNMWERYAHGTAIGDMCGVGIVIDSTQFLPSMLIPENVLFHVQCAPIDYLPDAEIVEHTRDYFQRLREPLRHQPSVVRNIYLELMLIAKAPTVKNPHFEDEKEIRFVHTPHLLSFADDIGRTGSIRVINRNGNDQRIFAMNLAEYRDFKFDFRISRLFRRVIVGPGPRKEERVQQIRELLVQHGLSQVEVLTSEIPIRSS